MNKPFVFRLCVPFCLVVSAVFVSVAAGAEDEPEKAAYIPEPEPVRTPILVGAHHCPLWEADKTRMWDKVLKHPDVRSALEALQAGQIGAVVYDAPILRYEAHQHFLGEVHVLPTTFERQDYAFALPTGSPLRERINRVLLRKIGSPEWRGVLADYLGERFE